jgi:hypothetical protein
MYVLKYLIFIYLKHLHYFLYHFFIYISKPLIFNVMDLFIVFIVNFHGEELLFLIVNEFDLLSSLMFSIIQLLFLDYKAVVILSQSHLSFYSHE